MLESKSRYCYLFSIDVDGYRVCGVVQYNICDSTTRCHKPSSAKFFELIIPIATFLTGTLSGFILSGGKDNSKNNCKENKD